MMSECERALKLLGEPMPDYAARDAQEDGSQDGED